RNNKAVPAAQTPDPRTPVPGAARRGQPERAGEKPRAVKHDLGSSSGPTTKPTPDGRTSTAHCPPARGQCASEPPLALAVEWSERHAEDHRFAVQTRVSRAREDSGRGCDGSEHGRAAREGRRARDAPNA